MAIVEALVAAAPDYAAFAAGIAVYGLLVNTFYQIISKRVMFLGRRGEDIEKKADDALDAVELAAAAVADAAAEARTRVKEADGAKEAHHALQAARKETAEARAAARKAVAKAERLRLHSGWRGVAHLVLFPLMAFAYFLLLSGALLFLAGDQRSPTTIFTLAIGIIAAVRVTAYLSEPTSHDLAKMLPLGLLGVFLVDAEVVSFLTALGRMSAMLESFEVIATLLLLTVALEFGLRAVYLTSVRIKRTNWLRSQT